MAKKKESHGSHMAKLFNGLKERPWYNQHRSGLRAILYGGVFLLALLSFVFLFKTVMVLFSIAESSKSQQQTNPDTALSETQDTAAQQTRESAAEDSTKTISANYQIIYGEADLRNDDGLYFYVLTDPVNLEKDDLKSRVEAIVRSMVKANGNKITVDIFDNKEALDIQYRVWVLKTLNLPLDEKQNALTERHQIASFEGGTVLGPSDNTIILFPNAANKTSEAGKLSGSYEFTP